ncbi:MULTISPECIES: chaplin [unclassified Streptomyces]|uniref:chaplin n=1 Tax=unclassified Streptomyces TaxID=2593676 RepID=UPI003436DA61
MRRATRNGVFAVVAASGAMAVAMPVSAAFAADGASADGAATGSPGVISGNTIQVPVHIPLNVCGNTVNVVGLLNPSAGNACENGGHADKKGGSDRAGSSSSHGGASAHGGSKDSPGVISGNTIQLPVHVPVNVTGNSVNVVGVGNPAVGNHSSNHSDTPETTTPEPVTTTPVKARPAPHTPQAAPEPSVATLAHTGADMTAPAVAGSAALLLTGTVLYRRFRPSRMR